jgi:hypothetical protein
MRALILLMVSVSLDGSAGAAVAPRPTPSRSNALAIRHEALSCVVAERFVEIRACVTPSDEVARAQVQFRALPTSPWYAVEMKPEGPCLTAVLPKPKRTTASMEYVVFALGRGLAESYRPEGAPAKAFTPRVVKGEGECKTDGMAAGLPARSSIQVTVVRDAAGQAVSSFGAPQEMAGFSSDGVTFGGSGAAADSAAGTSREASARSARASHGDHVPILAVAGGGAALVAVTAVALRGGDDGGSSGGGSGGGSSSPGSGSSAPGSGSPNAPGPMSGRWVGLVAENMGHITTQKINFSGDSCINYYDWVGTLTQTGNTLSGEMNVTFQGAQCTRANIPASAYPGSATDLLRLPLTPPGSLSLSWDDWVSTVGGAAGGGSYPLSGTYTGTTITLTGQGGGGGETWTTSLRLRKQ